jgi:hypothetical protein
LIVCDEADSLHKDDHDFVDLRRYIHWCEKAHILITSRSKITQKLSVFEGVQVGELDKPQARDLVFKFSGVLGT